MLKKEAIIKVLKKNSYTFKTFGGSSTVVNKDRFETIADQILSMVQMKEDVSPNSISGWLELAEKQPKHGEVVLLYNKSSKMPYPKRYFDGEYPSNEQYSYLWLPLPTIH